VLPNVRFLTFAGHQRNVFADTKSAFTPNDVFTTVIRLVIISGTATSQVAGVVRPVGKLGTSAPHMFRWPHRCDPMFRSMKRHRTWALSNLSGSPSRSPIRDFKKKKGHRSGNHHHLELCCSDVLIGAAEKSVLSVRIAMSKGAGGPETCNPFCRRRKCVRWTIFSKLYPISYSIWWLTV
jgi:hypothetical protein